MMKTTLMSLALLLLAPCAATVQAQILSPTDPILAIDLDGITSNSGYPDGEPPAAILDSNANTKYLNFGGAGSGFILTLDEGSSVVGSFQLTTANDEPGRDPSSWELYGTTDSIVSMDNSDGLGENWTLIDNGSLMLPDDRFTLGDVEPVSNTTAYTSYKMIYPTVKGNPLFQIADVQFFDLAMSPLLGAGEANSILAVQLSIDSKYPEGEAPPFVLDGVAETKYLNFGRENSGFIVTPEGPNAGDPVRSFAITTAGDEQNRDPASWELHGTNDPITSADNSDGMAENWTLISSGTFDDSQVPTDRLTMGDRVRIANDTTFASYRMVFPNVRGDSDSMQVADVQFYVPEPSSLMGLLLAGGVLLGAVRKRR